jgi:hypothetical protein
LQHCCGRKLAERDSQHLLWGKYVTAMGETYILKPERPMPQQMKIYFFNLMYGTLKLPKLPKPPFNGVCA